MLIRRLIELEADVCYREPAGPHEPEFEHDAGSVPVLISAPHGAVHKRNGADKQEDDYTAGLARLVAELSGAHALYARRRSTCDPNWDKGVPYKLRLADIVRQAGIRFVLDLHGAAQRRPFGIALGTLRGQSCPAHRPALLAALGAAGFLPSAPGPARLDVDRVFTASGKDGQETVTRYAWAALGVPAAQIEINECLRVVSTRLDAWSPPVCLADAEAIERIARALTGIVQAVH